MTRTSFVLELAPLRGENELEPHPQDEILVPFRGSFQNSVSRSLISTFIQIAEFHDCGRNLKYGRLFLIWYLSSTL